MSVPGGSNPLLLATAAGGGGGYEIERSLRFNSSDSAYLSRTPASAGNRKTFTLAFWMKLGRQTGENPRIFESFGSYSLDRGGLNLGSDVLNFYDITSGAVTFALTTLRVFRDPSAWYHICLSVDTTQATASNRVKVYVNGTQDALSGSYPSQNADLQINKSQVHYFSYLPVDWGFHFSGYLADIHFIDGQALDPSSFTEFDDNGVLQPKAYTGTYGTNGFHLPFSDNSTAAALGTDTSGNSNTWTVNNISVTAGAGNDSLVDSPTNYGTDTGAGGEVRGNYATWNPLYVDTSNNLPPTFTNGNLDVSWRTGDWNVAMGTIKQSSGKWYWEMTLSAGNRCMLGITKYNTFNSANAFYYSPDVYVYFSSNGNKWNNNTQTAYGASFVQGDVIGVALDLDAGTLVFYKNGVSQGTAFSSLSGNFAPVWGTDTTGNTHVANFGQRQWAYAAPAGFKALCTTNLPEPTIADGSTVMDVALYTGNGSTQTISGLNFSPDFVWIKRRDGANAHAVFDVIRGVTKVLETSNTGAEKTNDPPITSFDSGGFTVEGTYAQTNASGASYVGWTWDAGSSTVTNTQGSITSQVRANPSAGFSIITFTGTGANGSIGHGLNAKPGLIIAKSRSAADNWFVYHSSIGANGYILLNSTSAADTPNSTVWQNVEPTSSVFYSSTGGYNDNGVTLVAYAFSPVAGYSSFGSYTGNGSADGPFVFCNFRPRWLLIKASSTSSTWTLLDVARSTYNAADARLFADTSEAESSNGNGATDFLSNGFKLRVGHVGINTSGATYIYAAFAEHPFATSRAR